MIMLQRCKATKLKQSSRTINEKSICCSLRRYSLYRTFMNLYLQNDHAFKIAGFFESRGTCTKTWYFASNTSDYSYDFVVHKGQ